ncbi:MAG: hypothetical protein C4576_13590 [Desulfobacteraceae bacterium]|nr:MAG: hypothetical protein C4576_13590 [Desulfobacteraceae bacterium]
MRSVVFSTESASFTFPLPEVTQHLNLHESRFNIKESREILSFLSSSKEQTGIVPESLDSFQYFVLDFIGSGIGNVLCNSCYCTYAARSLISQELGNGANPLRPKIHTKGGMFRVFTLLRKRKRVGMIGGEGYTCPQGHELINVITWVS